MKIPCEHWSDSSRVIGGGVCTAGHHGGRPSYGVCAFKCQNYSGDQYQLHRVRLAIDSGLKRDKEAAIAKRDGGGCGCKRAPVVRWLGVRWLGVPMPKRFGVTRPEHWRGWIFFRWIEYQPSAGCGCILKLKRLEELLVAWWRI